MISRTWTTIGLLLVASFAICEAQIQGVQVYCFAPQPAQNSDCTASEQATVSRIVPGELNKVFNNYGLTPPTWTTPSTRKKSRRELQYTCRDYCKISPGYCNLYCGGGRRRELRAFRRDQTTTPPPAQFSTDLVKAAYVGYRKVAMMNTTSTTCKQTLLEVTCMAETFQPASSPTPAPVQCPTMPCISDLANYDAGDWTGDIYCGATVTARERIPGQTGGNFGPQGNQAMIFDSSLPTGGDSALGAPNKRCGGPGRGAGGVPGATGANCSPQGNLLIVSQDGSQTSPNANSQGGVLSFQFDRPVTVHGMGILDVEAEITIAIYTTGSSVVPKKVIRPSVLGVNSFQVVNVGTKNVVRMEMEVMVTGAVSFLNMTIINPFCA